MSSRAAIKHPHSGNDAGFLNERDVIGDDQEVVKNRGDRKPACNPVRNRISPLRLNNSTLSAMTTPSRALPLVGRTRLGPAELDA